MSYLWLPGDRVYVAGHGYGEVVTCVSGNGSFAWYFVRFDDETEDRFTGEELVAA